MIPLLSKFPKKLPQTLITMRYWSSGVQNKAQENLSMVSIFKSCRSAYSLLRQAQLYENDMFPRTYAIACRRMAHFINKGYIHALDRLQMSLFQDFVQCLFKIDIRLLAPIESLNILYFLRISKQHLEDVQQLQPQQIHQLSHRLLQQLFGQDRQLQFNKKCDLFQQYQMNRQAFPEIPQINTYTLLQSCQQWYPQNQSKIIDSIFHISSLFMNILSLSAPQIPIGLYLKLVGSVKELTPYFGFPNNLKIVDLVLASYARLLHCNQGDGVGQIGKANFGALECLLGEICQELENQGVVEDWERVVARQLGEAMGEMGKIQEEETGSNNKKIEDILLKLAESINVIKKKKGTIQPKPETQEADSRQQQKY